MTNQKYTLEDVGCYVDGSRGIHAIDRIVEIAEEHGMTGLICTCAGCDDRNNGKGEWHQCEWIGEIEDDCDNYMNDHYPVEGAYWGRSEQGDWGLWESEEE